MGDSIYGQGQEETKITVGEIRRTIDSISSELGELLKVKTELYEVLKPILSNHPVPEKGENIKENNVIIKSEIGEKLYEINRTIKCFKMSLEDLKEDICL